MVLVVDIPFEISPPIKYFLMLQIQAIKSFLKDIRIVVNIWLVFLFYLYEVLVKSQIATVTFLGGG